jgi:hypothetical protein
MLAGMTSLTSLAHGTIAAAPAFNGLFYATAATIIPVMFLALAVQGSLYNDLLKASVGALGRFNARSGDASPRRRALRAWTASILASGAAITILIFGVTGEIEALVSLSLQHAEGNPDGPLIAAVMLTLASAAGPALGLVGTVVTMVRRGLAVGEASRQRASSAETETEKTATEAETSRNVRG